MTGTMDLLKKNKKDTIPVLDIILIHHSVHKNLYLMKTKIFHFIF
jgi:hypothetical protein